MCGTFITYAAHAFNVHVFLSGCVQRRSRSLSLFETSIRSLESIITGVSTAFKAIETEKEENKNSIRRKETKNNTGRAAAEWRECPQLWQSFLQGTSFCALSRRISYLCLRLAETQIPGFCVTLVQEGELELFP